ncbi:MAG: hypothetical protein JOZ78_21525 [Chroococcidiopsidaceae cyanobacterium CP_BM_ER_R8_30]|nr:hypothetical protein [Chroococcidiopsidaceae cyanobacterium CP_BM_ER_R8_30]
MKEKSSKEKRKKIKEALTKRNTFPVNLFPKGVKDLRRSIRSIFQLEGFDIEGGASKSIKEQAFDIVAKIYCKAVSIEEFQEKVSLALEAVYDNKGEILNYAKAFRRDEPLKSKGARNSILKKIREIICRVAELEFVCE